jgi:hypothetical protein
VVKLSLTPILGCKSSLAAIYCARWRDRRVLRRILVVAFLVGLGACANLRARHAPAPAHVPAPVAYEAPKPASGLWAILDPGCVKPSATDIHAWPKCASPFWISGDKALLIVAGPAGQRAPRDVSYIADYNLDPGDPLIAQVGTQKDGYLFLALTDLYKDERGRLVGAVGAAVACPKPISSGVALKPSLNGCDLENLDTVRKAAAMTLQDHTSLTQVAWIAPGAP